MKNIFLFHGLQRSGNHAIINWLGGLDKILFFNNVIGPGPIWRGEKEIPKPVPYSFWLKKKLSERRSFLPFFVKKAKYKNHHVLASIEDMELSTRVFIETSRPVKHILLVRDPRNLFASRIRRKLNGSTKHLGYPIEAGHFMDRIMVLWRSHVREFLGQTSFLNNKTCIFFDAWFVSEEYRRGIASALGFTYHDVGMGAVTHWGGGSSFDGLSFSESAKSMRVLDRASQLTNYERGILDLYLNYDQEAIELSVQLDEVFVERASRKGS